MIVVIGRVRTDGERREALVELGQEVARASRAETGCIDYRLLADTEDSRRFVFIEQWADDAALQAHFRTPHIERLLAELPGLLSAAPEVGFHSVEHTRDLAAMTRRR